MDATDAPRVSEGPSAIDARALAMTVVRLLDAVQALLQAELALAGRSLRALALAVIFAPVLMAGLWLSVIALVAVALHVLGLDWLASVAADCVLQVLLVYCVVRAIKRWTSDLSLPQTRGVVTRLLQMPP